MTTTTPKKKKKKKTTTTTATTTTNDEQRSSIWDVKLGSGGWIKTNGKKSFQKRSEKTSRKDEDGGTNAGTSVEMAIVLE